MLQGHHLGASLQIYDTEVKTEYTGTLQNQKAWKRATYRELQKELVLAGEFFH